MTLTDLLILKYGKEFVYNNVQLQNDGYGDYISSWNSELPMPSERDLAEWRITFDTEFKRNQILEIRKSLYPSWRDQLDMIYWDKVNGTTNWCDIIEDIKKNNPLPIE